MTMKLVAALGLAWSLYCAADALMCETCVDDTDVQCTETSLKACNEGEVCLSGRLESNVGPRIVRKQCTHPARCGNNPMNTAFRNLHTNLGQGNGIIAGLCCDTHDGCNVETQTVSENVQSLEPNGLRCFTCNGPFDLVCQRTFECMGLRTRCVEGLMIVPDNRFQRASGCVSPNWCEGTNLHLTFFSPLITLSTFLEIRCCNDRDFCNGNRSVLAPDFLAATLRPFTTAVDTTETAAAAAAGGGSAGNVISRVLSEGVVVSGGGVIVPCGAAPLVMLLWVCALTLATK